MKLNISTRLYCICSLVSLLACVPMFLFAELDVSLMIAGSTGMLVVALAIAKFFFKDVKEGLDALEIGLLNLKDREFSTTLARKSDDEIGHLCELYNETVTHLRTEKHWLYQRELLLDKITQSSPQTLFLVNDEGLVVFSNIAARRFFHAKHAIEGKSLEDLLDTISPSAQNVIKSAREGLFTLDSRESENEAAQTWHMTIGHFLLNNQSHRLFILKHMSREISRQEVAVWKKVIRVISHELNNSLGPISSMLHSGRLLSEQLQKEDESVSGKAVSDKLKRVFYTIDDRIAHLNQFVQGYGKFAKIPEPKIEALSSKSLLAKLRVQWQFDYDVNQDVIMHGDGPQLEQLLINLLKNAHESGSDVSGIAVTIKPEPILRQLVITVKDAGHGIPSEQLSSVLIPFYSTKSSGTGLGLALCREIVEAHHGQIALNNRGGGGLEVKVALPML
ncbi:sensor histidine kinase [Ningiella sp. W23]|uniref:sensor histidine kinase n=1 Tax=Ningiella sp. W23 TaxID=3023715 RepID=UPI003756E138